jgi:hypothetical protein
MDIYIIHEFNIVKIYDLKNIVSHVPMKLSDFAAWGLGLPLAGEGRQLGGNANARRASVP